MRVDIQTRGFDLTDAMRAQVHRRLHSNLARFDEYIIAVDVYLSDINGPRGGTDKKALVCVQLASRLSVRCETVHVNLYGALAKATRGVRRRVKRSVRRQQRIARSELRQLRHLEQDSLLS